MSSSRTVTLLAWCADEGVQIDPRLEIVDDQPPVSPAREAHLIAFDEPCRKRGLSMRSRKEPIECASTLVYIPKSAVLSAKSCFFSQRISPVPYGHGAHLSLSLALYGEVLLGPLSRWFGYLQSLPQDTVDIAMFWGVNDIIGTRSCTCSARGCLNTDDRPSTADSCHRPITLSQCPWCVWLHDNQNANQWLEVTEADRQRVGLTEEVHQYYIDVVEPTFHAASTDPSLWSRADSDPRVYGASFRGFCYAYSLVSTRAFWVDAYHGLAMVPIADAFNHTNDNHLQMESDYDVCVECGSLAECVHDRETTSATVAAPTPSHDDTPTSGGVDYLEMRTVRPIPPFSEVFNTYGPLPNAALLVRYGFTLAENEHDVVRMVFDPSSMVRRLFGYADGTDGRVAIRNAFRVGGLADHGGADAANVIYDKEQRQRGQGIADNELPAALPVSTGAASVGEPWAGEDEPAWERMTKRLLGVYTRVAGVWGSERTWDGEEDGLVFNPRFPTTGPISFLAGDSDVSHDMVINADGQVSHKLWLFCILVALFAGGGDLIRRVERGPEAITSLTEFKAELISIQGWVERHCHIHDGDGRVGGDMEGGSTSSPPPLPHRAPPSLGLDYDSEPEDVAPPHTPSGPASSYASTTAPLGPSNPSRDARQRQVVAVAWNDEGLAGSVPQDPGISTSFSRAPQARSQAPLVKMMVGCHHRRVRSEETGVSHQEASAGSTRTHPERDGGRNAERRRPWKRIRRCSDAIDEVSGRIARSGGSASGEAPCASDDEQRTASARDVARLLARVVVGLCRERYRPPTVSAAQRGVGMTAAELGDMLDDRFWRVQYSGKDVDSHFDRMEGRGVRGISIEKPFPCLFNGRT